MELVREHIHCKIRCFYILFFVLCAAGAEAQTIHSNFDRITVKDGLSHSNGTYIIQDKTGFMWFATYYGMNRYDGHTLKTYSHNPHDSTSLSHNGVVYLFEDNNGYIWTVNASATTGLDRYNPEADNFTKFAFNPNDSGSISSNTVRHVMQDEADNIWICTSNALNLVVEEGDGNNAKIRFRRFYYPAGINEVTWAYADKHGRLLLFSKYLLNFNRATNRFVNTQIQLPDSRITSVAEDKSGNLFIGTLEAGIIKLTNNPESMEYEIAPLGKLSKCSGNRNVVKIDEKDQIWIGTEDKGLFKYDKTENRLENYVHDVLDPGSISDNYIYSLNIDRSGILWIGTRNQGVCKYDLYSKEFFHIKSTAAVKNSLSNNVIAGIDGNRPEELWVATSNGVNRILFTQKGKLQFIHYKHIPDNDNSLASDNAISLVQRKNGSVWVGTDKGFISVIIPETPGTGNRTLIKRYPVNSWTFTLFEDSEGTIWGGTWGGGLWKYNDEKNEFTYYVHDPADPSSICENVIWAIGEDKFKNIWIGGNSEGISILPAREKSKPDPEFINYRFEKDNHKSISNNTLHAFYEDGDGTMWIGTSGGLNRVLDKGDYLRNWQGGRALEFYSYGTQDGLPSDGIIGIVEDSGGNLWMSTANGISKFDFSDSIFYNFSESDGLQGDEFGHNAYYKNAKGRIYFGGTNGITVFDPGKIKANPFIPEIVITDLKLANQSVGIGQEINNDVILIKPIHFTSDITLSYYNNRVSFEFAALHYAQPAKNQYAYRLEGFEEDWNYVENQQSVSYTNLDAGKYTFRVKGSNNNGIWNETGTFLNIVIKPPWWKTWWFRIISFAVIVMFLLTMHSVRVAQIQKRKIYLEKKVKERTREIDEKNRLLTIQSDELNHTNTLLEERQQHIEEQAEELKAANDQLTYSNTQLSELNSMKDKIFTIIGHDLKNPINVILGFSELLKLKRDQLTPEKRNVYTDNIFESASKTFQLLESLLNWARSQSSRSKFDPRELQIASLINDGVLLLKEQASKKNITVIVEGSNDKSSVFCDKRMVETVIRNLLSNALKFTKAQGKITIKGSAKEHPGFYTIHIADTGLGISDEQLSKLFLIERSVSTEGTDGETGTGLGLVLCKDFVEKNKGEIWVESKMGTGTTFSFTIPLA